MPSFRPTSASAFQTVLSSGLVSKRQTQVYELVYRLQDAAGWGGMITQAEARRVTGDETRSFGPRFAELLRRDLLYEAGYKTDPVTKQSVIAYRTTDTLPSEYRGKPPAKVSRQQSFADKILKVISQTTPGLEPIAIQRIRQICEEVCCSPKGVDNEPGRNLRTG